MTSTPLDMPVRWSGRSVRGGARLTLRSLRPRPTLRLRLTLLYGGLFLITGAMLLGLNYALVRRSLNHRPALVTMHFERTFAGSAGVAIRLPALPAPNLAGAGSAPRSVPIPPEAVTIGGKPVSQALKDNEQSLIETTLQTLMLQSLIALGVMAVVSLGLGWFVAGRALRPVQAMTVKARRLSERNLHERIGLEGPADELKELADTFDAMLARLDAAFDNQRRFVANVSHELRTPLSIMRTEIDVTLADPEASPEELRNMAEVVREASERSERLIESLLILARSDRGLQRREAVDLSVHAARIIAQAQLEARRLGLRIEPSLAPAAILGDSALLERLIGNLVENALHYNQEHGWIAVATGSNDGHVWLRVANSGPAVPTGEVSLLFEPFRRLAAARTRSNRGTGLGLSIVRSVAEAHGGTVCARAPSGGGLEVEVRLPQSIR